MALRSATLAGVDRPTHHEDQAGLTELAGQRVRAGDGERGVAPAALAVPPASWIRCPGAGVALPASAGAGARPRAVIEDGMTPIAARLAGTERIVLLRPPARTAVRTPAGMDGTCRSAGWAGHVLG
ncbi:MAG: hypothetical protein M5T61_09875 [Acidimicrobiia bacterium]|nr:hypothetical protein [Acidimicrobiia bacterium]